MIAPVPAPLIAAPTLSPEYPMPETLFISDLHHDPGRPEIIKLAATFLTERATHADALYILGDLFEFWIGDDQPTAGLTPFLDALDTLKSRSKPIYFIPGNRDFLVGETFCSKYGITHLGDSTVIDLYGEPTLIMHGDTLCTDDLRYQQLRTMLRAPEWQQQFLALPLEERIRQALALREQSEAETDAKDSMIMDVNAATVSSEMQAAGVKRLIHGHTHRPAIHNLTIDAGKAQRIVLGDWYQHGSILVCNAEGCRLETISA